MYLKEMDFFDKCIEEHQLSKESFMGKLSNAARENE